MLVFGPAPGLQTAFARVCRDDSIKMGQFFAGKDGGTDAALRHRAAANYQACKCFYATWVSGGSELVRAFSLERCILALRRRESSLGEPETGISGGRQRRAVAHYPPRWPSN